MLPCFDEIDAPGSWPLDSQTFDSSCFNTQVPLGQSTMSVSERYGCGPRLAGGCGWSETEATLGSSLGPSDATPVHAFGTLSIGDCNTKLERVGEAEVKENLRDRQLLSMVSFLRECSTTEGEVAQFADAGYTTCDMSWLVNMNLYPPQ